jgi:hypothetical protein
MERIDKVLKIIVILSILLLVLIGIMRASHAATDFDPVNQSLLNNVNTYTDKPIIVNDKLYISADTIKQEFNTTVVYDKSKNMIKFPEQLNDHEIVLIMFFGLIGSIIVLGVVAFLAKKITIAIYISLKICYNKL